MALATIIANLTTVGAAVSGITSSFDADDTPDGLSNAEVPALLHFAAGGGNVRETFGGKMWRFRHRIRVLLAYKAAAGGRLEDSIGGIVGLVDSYVAAVRAADTLSAACEDAWVSSYGEPGSFEFAGVGWHGVEFVVEAEEYVQP